MVSDIKGLNSRQTTGAQQSQTGQVSLDSRSVQQGSSGGTSTDDTVALSGVAELIKSTAKSLASEAAVNEVRVKELKSALANGDYQVNPESIAKKLIDTDSQ